MSRLTAESVRIGDTDYPVYGTPLPETRVRAAREKGCCIAARAISRRRRTPCPASGGLSGRRHSCRRFGPRPPAPLVPYGTTFLFYINGLRYGLSIGGRPGWRAHGATTEQAERVDAC